MQTGAENKWREVKTAGRSMAGFVGIGQQGQDAFDRCRGGGAIVNMNVPLAVFQNLHDDPLPGWRQLPAIIRQLRHRLIQFLQIIG